MKRSQKEIILLDVRRKFASLPKQTTLRDKSLPANPFAAVASITTRRVKNHKRRFHGVVTMSGNVRER